MKKLTPLLRVWLTILTTAALLTRTFTSSAEGSPGTVPFIQPDSRQKENGIPRSRPAPMSPSGMAAKVPIS